MTSTYKSYFLFNEVKNANLQTYNRCVTFFNVMKDLGQAEAQNYIKQLDDLSKARVHRMLGEIRDKGPSRVKQEVLSSLVVH